MLKGDRVVGKGFSIFSIAVVVNVKGEYPILAHCVVRVGRSRGRASRSSDMKEAEQQRSEREKGVVEEFRDTAR